MKTMHQIFDDPHEAKGVVRELEQLGFTGDEVTILSGFSEGKGPETGATAGAVVGGGAGLLASLGVLSIPGLGPLVAAGWLLPVLTGGALGALVGGVLCALTDHGIPESDAHVYAETLRRGGALVIVRTNDGARSEQARAVLSAHQGASISERRLALEREGWRSFEDHVRSS
jgi:hypothetical protein